MRDDEIKNLNKLLEKLKQLKKEDRIFRKGEKEAKRRESGEEGQSFLVSIAEIVLKRLSDETGIDRPLYTPSGVKDFIISVEEFLAIFEEKGETVAVPVEDLKEIVEFAHEGQVWEGSREEILQKLMSVRKRIEKLIPQS